MSDTITAQLVGDRELIAKLGALSPKVYLRLVKAMHRVMTRLQAFVKRGSLTGQNLHVRTGHLRASVMQIVEEFADEIKGRVGIPEGPTLGYGRAHEFGFHDIVSVKEHLRISKAQARLGARNVARQLLGLAPEPGKIASVVRAHEMKMNVAAKHWLGGPFDEFRDAIRTVLGDVVREAVRE